MDTFKAYVQPVDQFGKRYPIDPFFTKLTGITEEDIQAEGVPLQEALRALTASQTSRSWSWGKDELNMVAICCYIAGIPWAISAHRFDNAVKLVIAAGMPIEDIGKMPSNKLADYYGVEYPPWQGHDALDDALSVAYAVQYLLRTGKLQPEVFDQT